MSGRNQPGAGGEAPAAGAGKSIAFKAGAEACKSGVKLKDSAIRNLRVGCQQYDDYIAGYDSIAGQK